jgi:hypothetical protein
MKSAQKRLAQLFSTATISVMLLFYLPTASMAMTADTMQPAESGEQAKPNLTDESAVCLQTAPLAKSALAKTTVSILPHLTISLLDLQYFTRIASNHGICAICYPDAALKAETNLPQNGQAGSATEIRPLGDAPASMEEAQKNGEVRQLFIWLCRILGIWILIGLIGMLHYQNVMIRKLRRKRRR